MSRRRSRRPIFALLLWLGASPLAAQVVRLPAVEATPRQYPGRLASHPDSSTEILQVPGETGAARQADRPPDARDGVFQKLIFEGTWLAGGGQRGLGESELELRTVLAFPCPTRDSPLIITPGFAVHYTDGPAGVDLPPRLFDAYTQFRWMHRLTPRWAVDLAVTPGVFSDFQQGSDDALRITGHGVVAWTCTPTAKIILGAAYLDRQDVGVLPVAGLIWKPHRDAKFELTFPRPRIARRVYWSGAYTDAVQDWIYVAGEFGGGTWAIAPAAGGTDVVNIRDFRIILGAERKVIGGLDARFEVGYVFGRKIEFDTATPDFEPTDTVMLRGGLTY